MNTLHKAIYIKFMNKCVLIEYVVERYTSLYLFRCGRFYVGLIENYIRDISVGKGCMGCEEWHMWVLFVREGARVCMSVYICEIVWVYVICCSFSQSFFLKDQITLDWEFYRRQPGVNALIPPNIKGVKVLVGQRSRLNLSPNVNRNIDSLNTLDNCPGSDK